MASSGVARSDQRRESHAVKNAALLVAFAASITVGAQQAPTQVFRADVEAVKVDALVERGGQPVTGLVATDFELLDDGVRQTLQSLSVETVPMNVVLVLDTSGSVVGARLTSLIGAARRVLEALRPKDLAGVLTFSNTITQRIALTSDKSRAIQALDSVSAEGSTALFDATYSALLLGTDPQSPTLLLIFSDGFDTASWLDSGAVIDASARSDAVVYAVTSEQTTSERAIAELMRNPNLPRSPVPSVPQSSSPDFLTRIAGATGGRVLRADDHHLSADFAGILKEFQNRYLLVYSPTGVAGQGWHSITVHVDNAKVQARRGYWR